MRKTIDRSYLGDVAGRGDGRDGTKAATIARGDRPVRSDQLWYDDESAEEPMSRPPRDSDFTDANTDTHPALPVESPRSLGVGSIVGDRYRLVSRLGGGAMGDVFVAENLAIRLRVAVKLLKPALLADPIFRERFQHEAQAIAAIEHPNVARFLDLVIGDPTFLVMEYVRGETLSERLRLRGPLPLVEAVQVAVRLCWALGAAHSAGIIHRDLKPANVILTPDLEHGTAPKLIDFGLAKLASTVEGAVLTRTGQVVGTPKYMSPEQIAGRAVDPRSDMYALGCLLHEMLTGRPPFDGDDDVQVIYQQIHDAPPRLRPLLPEAPEALERVLQRVLDKDPAARYASVADLARSLESSVFTVGVPRPGSDDAYPFGDEPSTGTATRLNPRPPEPAGPRVSRLRGVAVALLAGSLGFLATLGFTRLRAGAGADAGFLLVSDPAGARVIVDGKALDRPTPTWAAGLRAGAHTVRFEQAGASPVAQTVTLAAGERAVVQVAMPPSTHRLEVRSQPDGAQVFLDGRLAFGETPTYVEVTDNDFHELRLVKNGYQVEVRPLTPDDKQPALTVALKAETQPRGTVMVDSDTAAEVWIDGTASGFTTPTLAIQVSVGRHVIELRDGTGARGPSAVVDVAQGQAVRLLLGSAPPRR